MNDELRSLGGVRARGIALLLAVGVAGGAAGGAIDRWWTTRGGRDGGGAVTIERPRPVFGAEAERAPADEEIPYSLRSVKLSPEQVERIRALTARYRPTAESLMRSIRPRVIELNTRMQQEAMCVLSPEQRTEWVEWRKRQALSAQEGDQMLELVNSGRCPADALRK